MKELEDWRGASRRKPLILRGARQVGKTYVLKKFGQNSFPRVHYINFEEEPRYGDCFAKDLVPTRLLRDIGMLLECSIDSQDLLIFDEIQSAPKALTSLKYFHETEAPMPAIAAAGSLLGVYVDEVHFPVGKVDELLMHPMNLYEFMQACGYDELVETLKDPGMYGQISSAQHNLLLELVREYLVVGGLPEVVSMYSENRKSSDIFTAVRAQQKTLLNQYYADISKHSGKSIAMRASRIFQSIPAQLGRNVEGSTSRYRFSGVVPKVSKYDRLAGAFDWLEAAGLLHRILIATSGQQPLIAYTKENIFKVYCFDIGMLGALEGLPPEVLLAYDFGTHKGYFMENFVLQELCSHGHDDVFCWNEGKSEIEFLLKVGSGIVPCEVKAGRSRRAKSLGVYRGKYHPRRSVILSNEPYTSQEELIRLPHYLAAMISEVVA